jgi:hypothetical protein
MENLDCMDESGLRAMAGAWDNAAAPRAVARLWFPDRPRGFTRAASMVARYAARKADAMRFRAAGRITAAQIAEETCDQIYARLPAFARW